MKRRNVAYKLAMSGIFIAISTVFGTFSIPIFGAKMSPVQHFINVVSAVILGPVYALGNAFVTSLLRNMLGTGSLLAFPGSMIGALLAGLAYKKFKRVGLALLGEVIGTGIIGALAAYPIATLLLGKEVVLFVYIVPFSVSCIGGAAIAYSFFKIPAIRKLLIEERGEQ
ncbi:MULTISPECIES: energy coupling factor transporter S component ThiW [Clostridium]|uniref:Energy coupling factor transporter S component ThiW n=1 Tax=Clostridium cibarium TaxID=2762247 RepID=A0ABR8PQ63_9CLOT|nr:MULTISPECIES: energy coupling factor transporter S component ThiW [Clostridium]MBD7910298.1 energy coupling factor transporter S component ThiW [Clostridium cibarium]